MDQQLLITLAVGFGVPLAMAGFVLLVARKEIMRAWHERRAERAQSH